MQVKGKAVVLENFIMKKINLILFLTVLAFLNSYSQEELVLRNRIDALLKLTEEKNYEKILDYTYPKLFTIATKEQLIEALQSSLESDEFSIKIDSLKIDTIFPSFRVKTESFAKIRHSLRMQMKFKEPVTDSTDADERKSMANQMEKEMGTGNVSYDPATDALIIRIMAVIVAIKDDKDNIWYFVSLDEDNQVIIDRLFSKEVQKKMKEYN